MKPQLNDEKVKVLMLVELRTRKEKKDFINKYKNMKGHVYLISEEL